MDMVRVVGVGFVLVISLLGLAAAQEQPYGYAWSVVFATDEQGWAECRDLAVDPNGYSIVAGLFSGTLGLAGTGQVLRSAGQADIFLARLTPEGKCQWLWSIGGPWDETVGGVCLDPNGYLYLAGAFRSRIDIDPGPAVSTRTASGLLDGLVCRFRPDGSIAWVGTIGGPGAQVVVADICVDDGGGLYITGFFSGNVDFDPGPGSDIRPPRGYISSFVSRWGQDGTYRWTQVIGGSIYTKALAICATRHSGLYIGGIYNCPADFDPGPGVDYRPFHGDWDIFVTRLEKDGRYHWTRNLSGAGYDILCDLKTGPEDQVMVAGAFSLIVDMDPTEGEDDRYSDHQCVGAGFVGNWAGDGRYNWTYTRPDPSLQSAAVAVAVDKNLAYALFEQAPAGVGIGARSSLVLTLVDPKGRHSSSLRWGSIVQANMGEDEPLFWPQQWAVGLGREGDILIAGRFSGVVDIDPGPHARFISSRGVTDGIVLCLARPKVQ